MSRSDRSEGGARTSAGDRGFGWFLYQGGLAVALVFAGPVLLARRGRHYLPTLAGRLGRGGTAPPRTTGGLWLHAVSVGEVAVAATLAGGLPGEPPAVVTTVTPTGQERARAAFGAASEVAYLPFDLGFAVSRFFRRFSPRALVLVEGDYWPLLLREGKRRGIPVAVVNGRVGDRSFRRMRRLKRLLGLLFDGVERFGVQTEEDARRLAELGVDRARVTVTGNLKYEFPEPPALGDLEGRLGRLAGGRPLLVAGSTVGSEEGRVLEAFELLGGGRRALLVLAPRHPERWDEVAAAITARSLALVRRSRMAEDPPAGESPPADVVLLDSLGELASLYRLSAAAFVGGTLVRAGGHNPIEAARWGVPVAVGPSMENFRQIAEDFDRAAAWVRVTGASDLAAAWSGWLDRPDEARALGGRGRELVERNRGALAKTVEMLRPLIE